jgi:ABC-type transporter Mla subunit MlaD
MLLAAALSVGWHAPALSQAPEGVLSDAEVETLREAAPIPLDRIAAYVAILNDREKQIETLMSRPHRAGFGEDMHDAIEQFGTIADELNDNLDEYNHNRRDVRKALPKLIAAADRWSTALRAAGDDDKYKVVRKIALDTVKDMHDLAVQMQTDLGAYFKAHPEAVKAEKDRAAAQQPQ